MNNIAQLLEKCIEEADESTRNELAQALEDYSSKYSNTWSNMIDSKKSSPALAKLIDAMVESSDARIGWNPNL